MDDKMFREICAEIAHDIWCEWMGYFLFKRFDNEDYERWHRQIKTKYKDLDETEKELDRDVADEIIIPKIKKYLEG
jgi:hypothetical protein